MNLPHPPAAGRLARLLLLLVILVTAASTLNAERLPVRTYTTADGLRSSAIDYIMRDSRGFMWFGTRDGVSRYDGYGFVNYQVAKDSPSTRVRYIFESSKAEYWFATDRGLYRFNPNLPIEPQVLRSDVQGKMSLGTELISKVQTGPFHEDRNGNFWAGGQGLFLVTENKNEVQFNPVELNLPPNLREGFKVNVIAAGDDDSLWLGTTQGLLRRLPDGRIEHFSLHREMQLDTIWRLVVAKDRAIWIGHENGLYVLTPPPPSATGSPFRSRQLLIRKAQVKNAQPSNVPGEALDYSNAEEFNPRDAGSRRIRIQGLYQTTDGRVWVGLGRANILMVFDGRRLETYSSAQGLIDNSYGPFAEDLDGDLWIATLSGPIRLAVEQITSYDKHDGISGATVLNILDDSLGNLTVVTGDWGINRREDRQFRAVRPNLPQQATASWTSTTAFMDHAGEWWFLSDRQGLYRFSNIQHIEDLAQHQPTAIYTAGDGFKSSFFYCMFEDTRGDLWISTRDNSSPGDRSRDGLTRWERSSQTFHVLTEADGFPSKKSASSFAEDKAGNLWFGFYDGGMVRYARGRFTAVTGAQGVPQGVVLDLHIDHAGRLWVAATGGGLSRMDDPTLETPTLVSYLPEQGAFTDARCIAEDLLGRIYVGTTRGVDRLVPETGRITHYGVSEGLAGDFVAAAHRDRNGAIWFGTASGLSRLDPKPEREPIPPTISIYGLRVAGVRQPVAQFGSSKVAGLELSANQNDLQIDYSSLSIGHAPSLRYQYMLEGADRNWGAPTELRTVTYAKLAPGKFRFLVRAIDVDGTVSQIPASVSFTILSPVWQRWWFVLLLLMSFGLITYSLYRYRVGRLVELERVRTRIATDLHDDIGSSLSQISVLSEVIRQQLQRDGRVAESLSVIAGLSRDSVDSMSDIVWAINPLRDRLSDLTHRMRRFGSDVFAARNITLDFCAPDNGQDKRMGADLRREIFLIFKESVNNAARHSECTRAEIEFRIESGTLELYVRDNGAGFDATARTEGNGLGNMRQRAAKIGGQLEFISQPGQGTEIRLKVPLSRRFWGKARTGEAKD